MTTQREITATEVQQKAYAIYYAGGLRDRLLAEDAANHGRYLALDVATGDYEVDDRLIEATLRLHQRHPTPETTFGFRIGYPAAYKRSGSWKPEVEP